MFFNRRRELEELRRAAEMFKKGNPLPVAVIGLRRIGKTELIQKFREERKDIPVSYLNAEGSVSSPEIFVQDFYIALLEEFAAHRNISIQKAGSKREVIISLSSALGEEIRRHSISLLQTIDSRDYNEMVKAAFRAPEEIAQITKTKIILCIDEFQDLEELNNFRFGDIFKIMRSVCEKQKNSMYILSGSVISFMEKLLSSPREPFFNQFRQLSLSYFTKEDSIQMIKNLLTGIEIEESGVLLIFKYTLGHPFYITAVCERIFLETKDIADEALINYAVAKETIDKNGKINLLFKYIFEESLKKAKRRGHLRTILLIIADKEGLTLTNIAESIKKPTGQVSNYLKSLLRTDIIFESDKNYFFRDPLFRFWIAKTQLGKDIVLERDKMSAEDYISDLKEKYLRASTELGRAVESEAAYNLEKEFGMPLKRYVKGNIEFDLVGEKAGRIHIFEIKWRTKPAGYSEVQKFLDKVRDSEFAQENPDLFILSKTGLTRQAEKLALKNNIRVLKPA
jgi:AAA+ ATPase superfamily predicted ATPase